MSFKNPNKLKKKKKIIEKHSEQATVSNEVVSGKNIKNKNKLKGSKNI